jgi:PAP2 superfamily
MNRRQLMLCIPSVLMATLTVGLSGTVAASADPVSDWNAILFTTSVGENPFAQARFAAITQLAVFEAVNAIEGNYKPYLGTISAPAGASAEAAAIAAAYTVLTNYFPAASASLDTARAASLAGIPNGPGKSSGLAVGEAAANAMIALRSNDGASPPAFFLPSSTAPGEWQLTPTCPAPGGVFFHWSGVTPFGVRSSAQFRADPPPTLTGHRYARAYREVKEVGSLDSTERPPDRLMVTRFFGAVSAPVAWNSIARQLATSRRHSSLADEARIFALLNMAISDGLVTVFESKYHYRFWRPETAIHNGDLDGNPRTEADPSFVPLIPTPCFPSYPSAHASGSYAAQRMLRYFYGDGPHQITLSNAAVPGIVLPYTRLADITDDVDDARVYGGIHFRTDQDAGAEQGRRIAEYVYRHQLRRQHDRDRDDDDPDR